MMVPEEILKWARAVVDERIAYPSDSKYEKPVARFILSLPPKVEQGSVSVPREPSEKLLNVMIDAWFHSSGRNFDRADPEFLQRMGAAYRAMLLAAPNGKEEPNPDSCLAYHIPFADRRRSERRNLHIATAECGFDRNSSHSEGCYVCMCGWADTPDPVVTERRVSERRANKGAGG